MMASLIGEMMSNGEPVSGIRGSHSTPQRYCTWLLFGQEQRWRFFAAVAACTNQAHWVRRSCGRCCLAFHLKIGMELMIRLLAAHSSLAWSNQRKSPGECNSATSRSSGGLPVCIYIYQNWELTNKAGPFSNKSRHMDGSYIINWGTRFLHAFPYWLLVCSLLVNQDSYGESPWCISKSFVNGPFSVAMWNCWRISAAVVRFGAEVGQLCHWLAQPSSGGGNCGSISMVLGWVWCRHNWIHGFMMFHVSI